MKVTIYRRDSFFNLFRNYKVLLNGKVIGRIANNDEFTFELESSAVLMLKIDWCLSNKIKLDPLDGDIRLITQCNIQGWRIIFTLLYITIYYKNYLKVYRDKSFI